MFIQRLLRPARLGSSTWLLLLRSFAIVGQLLTILASCLLTELSLPYTKLVVLVALTASTNLAYAVWLNRTESERSSKSDQFVALVLMLLDLITLTAMLHFSGGTTNPFSFFYFVNLAVGGVMIQPRAAWSLTATAIIGYACLLWFSQPLSHWVPRLSGDVAILSLEPVGPVGLQQIGLMIAFATCSSVVTYFVTRTSGELRRSESELLQTQAAEAANRQLEGLTTLAAGAAHELATPLSTIDVVVRELSHHLDDVAKPESVTQDLRLIDGELERCRQILQRMRSASGDSMTGQWQRTTVGELIDAVLEGIRDPHRVDVVETSDSVENHPLWVPQEAVAQAIRNLVHNGLDASQSDDHVKLEPFLAPSHLTISVKDRGSGMTSEILDRVSDPFFTTKPPGRGIGLGLFLTRNVVSQLGGTLNIDSVLDSGTTASVTLPLSSKSE